MKTLPKAGYALLFLILLLIAMPFRNGRAQISGWSTPHQFEEHGWFPDIAADPSGALHVAWSHSRYLDENGDPATVQSAYYGFDVVLYTVSEDGSSWPPANDIAALPQGNINSVEVTRPNLLADVRYNLHMTFRGQNVYYTQSLSEMAALARGWGGLYQLNVNNQGYFSDLAIDRNGVLHLVFTENVVTDECMICFHLYYRQSIDGGANWSIRSDLSNLITGAAKPQILIDASQNIHVVWESGPGGTLGMVNQPVQIMYTVSRDGGMTWVNPRAFTDNTTEIARNPVIASDGSGRLLVAWHNQSDDRLHYTVSPNLGQTWTPFTLEGIWGERALREATQTGMAMATDSAGNIHWITVGRLTEQEFSWSLLHLTWNGVRWSDPEVIVNRKASAIEWPRLAISRGNQLNVVWFERPLEHLYDANPDFYTIFYSNSTIAAPEVEAPPRPTPVPIITPTPIPTPVPTPTRALPDLTSAEIVPGTTQMVSSELDDLLILAASLLPATAIIGIIFGWNIYRRKKS